MDIKQQRGGVNYKEIIWIAIAGLIYMKLTGIV